MCNREYGFIKARLGKGDLLPCPTLTLLKRLSSPNAFIGDPDFKDLKDWIPDKYLGNDRADRPSGKLERISFPNV